MIVLTFVVGGVVAAAAWVLLTPAFSAPVFTRRNFRDRELPTAAGVIVALILVAGTAALEVANTIGDGLDGALLHGMRVATLVGIGFAFLGLLDDLGGEGQSGGFRGHLAELAHGRLTTGATKLFGGAAVGVIAAASRADGSMLRLLLDGALIALAANAGNLFDRAPGRVTKVALIAGVILVAAVGLEAELAGVTLALGAGAGLLLPDLRERLMLGDAGANVLGAVLGLGVVLTCGPTTRTLVLVVVIALNAASEVVSFSKVIERTAPLRSFDHFGRVP